MTTPVSDNVVILAIITGGFATLTLVLNAVFAGMTLLLNAKIAASATLAAVTAARKADETLKVVNDVHVLTNNNMRIALQGKAVACRSLAVVTKLSADVLAAELAEQAVADHDIGQAKLDAEKKIRSRAGDAPYRRE